MIGLLISATCRKLRSGHFLLNYNRTLAFNCCSFTVNLLHVTEIYENLMAILLNLLNICKYYQEVKLLMFSLKLQMLIHFWNKTEARADSKETKSQVLRLGRHCHGVWNIPSFLLSENTSPYMFHGFTVVSISCGTLSAKSHLGRLRLIEMWDLRHFLIFPARTIIKFRHKFLYLFMRMVSLLK